MRYVSIYQCFTYITIYCVTDLLARRKDLLESKWWLTQPTVSNDEWLYLFEEETRHSVMIEWYFSEKQEISQVIHQQKAVNTPTRKAVMWYFDAASLIYEYAYQQYKNNESFLLRISEIKTIHSLMMKWINPSIWGKWREWDIRITSASIQPPYWILIPDAMEAFITFSNTLDFGVEHVCESSALLHTYFEATHPFEDGNGRIWRILINYILISHGYPSIIIKGTDREKEKYFEWLESCEIWLLDYYPEKIPPHDRTEKWDIQPLKTLIEEALFQSIDRIILTWEKDLEPVSKIVEEQWYDKSYGRQLVKRGKVIAKKIGNTWYSNEKYFLR